MKPKKSNWKTAADMKRSEETWHNEVNVKRIVDKEKRYMIKEIRNWCYQNNTIPLKDIFKDFYGKSNLKLASLDGGWVNVLKLEAFMAKLLEEGKK